MIYKTVRLKLGVYDEIEDFRLKNETKSDAVSRAIQEAKELQVMRGLRPDEL